LLVNRSISFAGDLPVGESMALKFFRQSSVMAFSTGSLPLSGRFQSWRRYQSGGQAPKRVVLAVLGRSFSSLHLLAKELPNAINGEQAFAARLAAPSQTDAFDVPAVVEFVKQTPTNRETPFNAARVEKLRIFFCDVSRCRTDRGSCLIGSLSADFVCVQ
jgi:hypothetical protein